MLPLSSFAWIALTITGIVPYQIARFTMYHGLTNGPRGFEITHSGSVHVENETITWHNRVFFPPQTSPDRDLC